MKIFYTLILFISMLFFSQTALAANGKEFLKICQYNQGFCEGYVFGVSDLWENSIKKDLNDKNMLPKNWVCIPNGTRPKQLLDIVINYINQKPELINLPIPALTIQAYQQTYKCNH